MKTISKAIPAGALTSLLLSGLLGLFALFPGAQPLAAQERAPQAAAPGAISPDAIAPAPEQGLRYGQGLLWRIDSEGTEPSYLFGTMHSTDPKILDLPEPVVAAFAKSRSLAVELVMTDEVKQYMGQAMLLPEGERLDRMMGGEHFQELIRIFRTYGLPPEALPRFAPWAAMSIISVTPTEFGRINSGILPLDEALQDVARKRGMKLYGLESVQEQIAVFRDVPREEQVELLEMAIREHDHLKRYFNALRDAYLTRDLAAIHRLMREQAAGSDPELMEAFEDRLIVVRNKRMAVRMMEHLDRGSTFVAVGALHLPGEEGILRLLEGQGRSVTRIY